MARAAAWRIAVAMGLGLTLAKLALAGPVLAASPFSEDSVRAEVARQTPSFWTIEAIALEPVESTTGNAGFSVRLRLAKATYVVDSVEGPYTFVQLVTEAGVEKSLIGVAKTKDGGLTVELQDAAILDSVGEVVEGLPGKVIITGSEEAQKLRARLDADFKQRLADEQAHRQREEALLAQRQATDQAESERLGRERQSIEARTAQIKDLRAKLMGAERAARIAAYEAVLGGDDPGLRQFAVETALQSRDPILTNLALRDWITRHKTIPVLLYATKEDPNSETVLRNLGPLTVEVESFSNANGTFQGKMGAAGYSVAAPSAATGTLAQTDLTVNTFGCILTLRLTEHRTLDGLYRCQTLPTLVARVTVD